MPKRRRRSEHKREAGKPEQEKERETIMEQLLHTPEGVRDIYNGECARKLAVEQKIRETMNLYGYRDIQTPGFEFFDIFRKERGSVASKDMFKFFDREGNTLVLRPDMTPSIARCAAKYFSEETIPVRLCYLGNTYTNNSGYQGRLKECTDAGAELIGDAGVQADAEMVALVIHCLLEAGLTEFQIELGHAGFFDGLLEEAKIREKDREELRELFDNKNYFGIENRISQLPIAEEKKELFRKLPQLFGTEKSLALSRELLAGTEATGSSAAMRAVERLEKIYEILKLYGLQKYVSFDLGMMVTYRYYTGVIFKGYTYGTGDTIVSGGRYDTLMAQYGKDRPSVGFKISVDGLLTAMERQKIRIRTEGTDVLVVCGNGQTKRGITLAGELRKKGVRLAVYHLEGHNLEDYVEYGKRMGANSLFYIGENGKEAEKISLKTGENKNG